MIYATLDPAALSQARRRPPSGQHVDDVATLEGLGPDRHGAC